MMRTRCADANDAFWEWRTRSAHTASTVNAAERVPDRKVQ
jgi:hypothetical protein